MASSVALFSCVDQLRLSNHGPAERRHVGGGRQSIEAPFHPLQRPEQVHGRRPRLANRLADEREFGTQLARRNRRRALHSQRHAHGRRDSDGRRAADDHVANRLGDVAIVGVSVTDELAGQASLIDHHHAFLSPLDGLCNAQANLLLSNQTNQPLILVLFERIAANFRESGSDLFSPPIRW